MDEFCPHRGASLCLGRNEENGLRCVYHGWKYDVTGPVRRPDERAAPVLRENPVKAYPTCEQGGVVWAYMGPRGAAAAARDSNGRKCPRPIAMSARSMQACNWLQALEGGIDTSHFTIMHRALKKSARQVGIEIDSPGVRGGPPTLEVDVTDYGYRYFGLAAGRRNALCSRLSLRHAVHAISPARTGHEPDPRALLGPDGR